MRRRKIRGSTRRRRKRRRKRRRGRKKKNRKKRDGTRGLTLQRTSFRQIHTTVTTIKGHHNLPHLIFYHTEFALPRQTGGA